VLIASSPRASGVVIHIYSLIIEDLERIVFIYVRIPNNRFFLEFQWSYCFTTTKTIYGIHYGFFFTTPVSLNLNVNWIFILIFISEQLHHDVYHTS